MKRKPPKVCPNAPLTEAIFEIKFPGEISLEAGRAEIQKRVRSKLPKVLVPNILPGQSPDLQSYHFASDDKDHTLMVAMNAIGYSSKKYRGFAAFSREALGYLTPIGRRFGLMKLNRVGLRYINVIPFARKDDAIPLRDFLNLRIELPAGDSAPTTNLALAIVKPCGSGVVTTRLEAIKSPEGTEALLLDFDYSRTQGLLFSKVRSHLSEGHDHTKKLFESLISPEYRRIMETEVLS